MSSTTSPILAGMIAEYRRYKMLADGAFAQVTDEQLLCNLSPAQNSLYVIAQHLSGNLKSRFTDFLTTDGEKPDRNRDGEFAEPPGPISRPRFLAMWEVGWSVLFESLATLTDADLARTVLIRTEPHTVALAITRQLSHYAWHVGQIILLSKHLVISRGGEWNYLTIPPGKSSPFNRDKGMK